jgi:hypothetical protein
MEVLLNMNNLKMVSCISNDFLQKIHWKYKY